MRKLEIKLNLERIAFVSCTVAALLLIIEILWVTLWDLSNALVISSLVFTMTVSILVCLVAVSLQFYFESLKDQS